MPHNFGKVWAGSYGENHLIINGEAVEPVSFKEDDEDGEEGEQEREGGGGGGGEGRRRALLDAPSGQFL